MTIHVSLHLGLRVTIHVSLHLGLGVTIHVSLHLGLGVTIHVSLHLGLGAGGDPGSVEPEVYTIFEALLKKRMQNYEYKIRYKSENSLRMRKEITTNYKFKTAFKYHKHHEIQKNKTNLKQLSSTTNITKSRKIKNIFLLINCLTQVYNTFILHFLAAYSLIASSYYNDFII